MISVIIPAYNCERTIVTCLESVQKQIYPEFECIVICNGCNDKTFKLAKQFEDEDNRFRIYDFTWSGLSKARNKGVELSHGDYITFLDADDLILPHYLETFANELKTKKDVNVIKSPLKVIRNFDETIWGIIENRVINANDNIMFSQPKYDIGHVTGGLFNRKLFDDIIFNENIECFEDCLFMMEVILKVKDIHFISSSNYIYMYYNGNLSKKTISKTIYMSAYNSIEEKFGENAVFRRFITDILLKKHGID